MADSVQASRKRHSRPPGTSPTLAAIDLGSNSFHMIIARLDHGRLLVLDRLREPVRLAGGLNQDGTLDDDAAQRAIDCLTRFGQRIAALGADQVRAVGTNTLRRAKGAQSFRKRAAEALGHDIEIIAGSEEARLIYLGVCHGIAGAPARRLVVDIGGGSTECIVGDGFEPIVAHSLFMGCVGYTKRFFSDGEITKKRFLKAQVAAELELQPVAHSLRKHGWERAYGASGTIRAVADILEQNGWASGTITKSALDQLQQSIITAGSVTNLKLAGLSEDRRPVFAAGVAILQAIVQDLQIDELSVSPTALREGLLYDLLGRLQEEDPRDRTIEMFARRYALDTTHAARVEETAMQIFDQVRDVWALDDAELEHSLTWCARLHELGLAVNFTAHHKHGAYLLEKSDMPGFNNDEQRLMAAIIRGHRRKFSASYFEALGKERSKLAMRLCLILRLAVLLNRSRDPATVAVPKVNVDDRRIVLKFPEGWLGDHPLLEEDLEQEANSLKQADWRLKYRD